jgi:hypothetical protein
MELGSCAIFIYKNYRKKEKQKKKIVPNQRIRRK